MKPLKVAIIYKSRHGIDEHDQRAVGWWSYPVPEFEFEFFRAVQQIAMSTFNNFDLVFHEDTTKLAVYVRHGQTPPVVYMSVDSTLSDAHYKSRLALAKQADLVLVDHDKLERFKSLGKPVRRFSYCVDEHIFKPLEKELDVSYHCGSGESRGFPGGKERNEIRRHLGEYCSRAGCSYRSGAVGQDEYASDMGKSRVVVNWPRTVINRPHRVLDTLACGAALLTGPIPQVDGDCLVSGIDYVDYADMDQLDEKLKMLLEHESWKFYADAGYKLAMERHTWSVRAQELRLILNKELGL